ncbi:hypothetical protein [Gordonia sputi]|uniref:hypothetical protein n=1 Tax=Gordonia sputi TaxID=36823 RepID=UPI0014442548|nr:hypothetical protein [Gordonia sputi]NKY93365.1 hypothetical protein [Gordonia sputi]
MDNGRRSAARSQTVDDLGGEYLWRGGGRAVDSDDGDAGKVGAAVDAQLRQALRSKRFESRHRVHSYAVSITRIVGPPR